jgi:hypothetical protein
MLLWSCSTDPLESAVRIVTCRRQRGDRRDLPSTCDRRVMNAWSSARRGVARHTVLAFMLISLGIGFVTAAIPPIADSEIPPFDPRTGYRVR